MQKFQKFRIDGCLSSVSIFVVVFSISAGRTCMDWNARS